MLNEQLKNLQTQTNKLLAGYEQKKLENHSLNRKLVTLNQENVDFLKKKKVAIDAIKSLIKQLEDQLS